MADAPRLAHRGWHHATRSTILAPMLLSYHVMSSPIGLLFLASTDRGLRYLEFMDRRSLKRMIATHAPGNPDAQWRPSLLELKPVVDQLEAYFHGTRTDFTVRLDPVGSQFQLRVWAELQRIPYGRTRSYGEIASAIGQPKAARAVGLANNQNPIAIIVPCHRVIGADGSLVGYGGGIARKKWLLENEARYARLEERSADRVAPLAHPPVPAAPTAQAKREQPAGASLPQSVKAGGGPVAPTTIVGRPAAPADRAPMKPAKIATKSATARPRSATGRPRGVAARATARAGRAKSRRAVATRPARRRTAR